MKKLNINESFICKIWEGNERFYSNVSTTEGELVKILNFGKRNYDSGPDYKDAKIKIGDKTYIGDVEVHREFKDWYAHRHKRDSKYNSVILQVVLWDSLVKEPPRPRIKREIPTVILSQFLNRSIHLIWQEIIDNPDRKLQLPCSNLNHKVDDEAIVVFLNQLAIRRLDLKATRIKERLIEIEAEKSGVKINSITNQQQDWDQALYEFTFEALGYSKNKEPMLKLAKNLRLAKIRTVLEDEEQILQDKDLRLGAFENNTIMTVRALLYGAGGLLFDLRLKNKYANKLKYLWDEYKKKLKISVVSKSEWHFFRLRPQNFPSVRLAYGAELILKILYENLFKKIMIEFQQAQSYKINETYSNFTALFGMGVQSSQVGDYLSFLDKEMKYIGKERITDIIVNVIIPLAYLYSIVFRKENMKKNILSFYNSLIVRTNNSVLNIVRSQLLKKRNIKINTAAIEQAAIQLYNFYCMREQCLECKIGGKIFSKSGYEYKIIFY